MKNVRDTSIEAFNTIKENGLLSKRRWQVYDCVFNHGPLTVVECCKILSKYMDTRSISPRFTELRKMGVFSEVGEKKCSITGKNVILWDVTSKLPIELKHNKKVNCPFCDGTGHYIPPFEEA